MPTKIRISREVGEQDWANTMVPFFENNPPDQSGEQKLHSEAVARILPFRVPKNPYLKWPKTSHKEAFAYKMMSKECKKKTTDVEKAHFINKNELKTYKNQIIKDNVHYLDKDAIYRKAFRNRTKA